ncbi:nucleolar complex protein 2 homolog [Haliotis rufescens]|uniref:nucleolar complex protein 2 homolog n=1 Tax=Haliotis rufescens TaxID=6454 RepID=UPI00201F33CB|nr:nucleolar complex protein 2 homolog [Haliotis rufescens]
MTTSSTSMATTKRKLADLSVDEFMSGDFDSDDSSSLEPMPVPDIKGKKNKKKKKAKTPTENTASVKKQEKPSEKSMKTVTPKSSAPKSAKSKQSLAEKLKEADPEFYKFLETEDKKLLEFDEDVDDEDDEDDDADLEEDDSEEDDDGKDLEKVLLAQSSEESSDDDEEEGGGKFHKLPDKLEVASDDSDAEDDEEEVKVSGDKQTKVTMKMVKKWSDSIESSPNIAVLREAISAFKAAVKKASEKQGETIKYKVVGSTVFNGVVRLCLMEVVPALQSILKVPDLTQQQTPFSAQNAKWKKLRVDMKSYMTDLLTLLSALSDAAMLNVILKHIHKLVSMYATFPKVARLLLKKMILLWSTGEETTRVLAFLCINKLVRMLQDAMLEPCMKQMYMAYVKNVKFTSPTTLPLINFMQRSLVEIFLLDSVLAYQYAFIYIRQLAIHLRNAITVKKKDTCQAVYNWQFVHCVELWACLLGASQSDDVLHPLIYPLTQTIIGTIKLLPSPRYFPLRFHCVRCLNTLSKSTGTFIPVLPFLLEVFELTDFNKKHKSVSFKPFNFACILKFSKKQQEEKVFKDGLVDQLYELLLEQFNNHASSIGFPELVLPAMLQLKDFLKKCKIANYCKQIRQIVDKVEDNVKFITQRRKAVTFAISDSKAVEAWERQCSAAGAPLTKYYTGWRKLRDRELQHEIAGKDRISLDDNIPTIERPKVIPKATAEDRKEFSELFDSDSDESDDDETRFLPRKERPAKKQKTSPGDSEDSQDYSDFDSDELEQLAQSASDDDDDDDDDDDEEEEEKPQPARGKQKKVPSKQQKQTAKPVQMEDDSDLDLDDVVEDFEMSDSD